MCGAGTSWAAVQIASADPQPTIGCKSTRTQVILLGFPKKDTHRNCLRRLESSMGMPMAAEELRSLQFRQTLAALAFKQRPKYERTVRTLATSRVPELQPSSFRLPGCS